MLHNFTQNSMQTRCFVFELIFWQLEQHFYVYHFLQACKNHTIHRTMFVLVLNDAENIPLSENIIVICVSFTRIPPPPLKDTDSWLTRVSHQTNNRSHISYAIQCRVGNVKCKLKSTCRVDVLSIYYSTRHM